MQVKKFSSKPALPAGMLKVKCFWIPHYA